MSTTPYRTPYREYAAAIYELREAGLAVIQARVAEWLGVTRASVSEMIRHMVDDGLVVVGDELELTEAGRHLAEVVVRRHRLAERFLTEVLAMPWVKVHAEAEVWEHAISDDVEQAMWAKLDNPRTCPHGNPIPGAGYRPPPVRPLADLQAGDAVRLERISEELELDGDIMEFLDTNGMHPGAALDVVTRSPEGTLTISVADISVGVGRFIAERVFVV